MPTITVDIKATGGAQLQREIENAANTLGRRLPQATQQADAQLKSLTKTLEVQSAVWARVRSQAVGAFAGAIGVGAIVSFTKSIMDSTNQLIGWQNALAAVTGTAAGATDSLNFIRSEADRLGLSIESMSGMFARFSAATRGTALEGEKTREIFTAMSEAARVLNLSTDGVAGAFRALEQMVSKGSVQAEELRQQLGERLPGAFRIAADALGVTTKELNKMLEMGQVTAEDLLPKLAARLRELYSGSALNAANSPAAEFNRLSNALFDLRVAIAESGVMEQLTVGARQATESIRTLVSSGYLEDIASALGTVATAGALAFGGKALGSLTSYIGETVKATKETVAAAKANEGAAFAAQRRAAVEATAAGSARLYAEQVMRSSVGTEYAAKAANDLAAARIAQNKANFNLIIAEKNLAAAQAQTAASANVASVAIGKLGGAAKTVFSAVGGWATVAVAAAYAIYQIQDAMRNGDAETQKLASGLDDLSDRMEKNTQNALKMREGVSQAFVESSTAIAGMTQRIAELQAGAASAAPKLDDFWSKYLAGNITTGGPFTARIYEAFRDTSAIDAATESLRNHYDQMARSIAVSDDMVSTYRQQARAVFVANGSMEDYNESLRKAIPELARGVITSKDSAKAFEQAAKIIQGAGGNVDDLRKAIADLVANGAPGIQNFADVAKMAFGDAGVQVINFTEKLLRAVGIIENISTGTARDIISPDLKNIAKEAADALDDLQKKVDESNKSMRTAGLEGIALIQEQAKLMREDAEARYANADSAKALVDEWERNQIAAYNLNEQMKQSKKPVKELRDEQQKLSEEMEKFATQTARQLRDAGIAEEMDDLARATASHAAAVSDMDADTRKQFAAFKDTAAVEAIITARTKAMNAEFAVSSKTIKSNEKAFSDYIKMLRGDYSNAIKLAGMSEQGRRAEEAGIRAVIAAEEMLNKIRDENERNAKQQEIFDTASFSQAVLDATELARQAMDDVLGPEATGIFRTIDAIKTLQAELDKGGDNAGAIQEQIRALNYRLTQDTVGALRQATDAMAGLFEEGSSGQRKMEKAGAALAVIQSGLAAIEGVRAVLNQGSGDPYSAFARMAAMAAAVAPLIASIGAAIPAFSGSGDSSNSAAARQAAQGAGSVLGDSEAKSESILKAMEITADATSELVGINRGMLNALQAMQAGISGASASITRVEFGKLGLAGGSFDGVIDSIFGTGSNFSIGERLLSSIFGGKQKLIDQGILIVGGTLSGMIDNIMASAFQTIETDGGWFRSDKVKDALQDLGDDATRQLQLVLASMADAVRAGADALGLNMDEVNRAIEQYQIAEIRISTQGLTGEEAQKELEAVFSAIFDGLAGQVVPFIDQFQKVGEGLGETLVRVATSVQVTQEAVRQLGFVLDSSLGPEAMAQVSVGLIDAAGGIENFVSGMQSFVSSFAPEAHKFEVAQDALNRALEQFGIAIPPTRDAMWELMQSLDATTAQGQEQIAMLLEVSGASDTYYQWLEKIAEKSAEIDARLADNAWGMYLDGLDANARAVAELTKDYDDLRASFVESGASAEQLAMLEMQRAEAMGRLEAQLAEQMQQNIAALNDWSANLRASTEEMTVYAKAMRDAERWREDAIVEANRLARAAGLAGARVQDLASIELRHAQLAAQAMAQLEQSAKDLIAELYGTPLSRIEAEIDALTESESAAASAIGDLSNAMSAAAQAAAEAMGLLLGSYSPLRASDKLPIALEALRRGETDANTVLGIAREVYSSGAAYNRIFEQVQAIVASQQATEIGGGGGDAVSAAMQRLLDERDALLAEQEAANRFGQASQLAELIAELAGVRGEGFDAVADSLGFGLDQLAADLRLANTDALSEYLTALQADQLSLADIFAVPTVGDELIASAIFDLGEKFAQGWNDGEPITNIDSDPIPVVVTEGESQRAEENTALLREVRDLLTRLIEPATATATATEATADGVALLREAIEAGSLDAIVDGRRIG